MFIKRKTKVTCDELASLLIDESIMTPHVSPLRDDLSNLQLAAFSKRVITYQQAFVIVGLGTYDKTRSGFGRVGISIRGGMRSFRNAPTDMEVGRAAFDTVKLIESAAKPYTWARKWYAAIGVDESNPAVLGHLASQWLQFHETVLKSLRMFDLTDA
jgi:hypothetical protein